MKSINKIHYKKSIDAIVPIYNREGNNVCSIIYPNGTSIVESIHVDKFIRIWLQILRIDICSYRMWAQEILHRRNGNPIVIHEHMVFIPVKMRKPIGSKDGSYGYVQLESIDDIVDGAIHLKSGRILPCMYTKQTMERKIKDAKLIQYSYIEERKMYDIIYRRKSPGISPIYAMGYEHITSGNQIMENIESYEL